MVQSAGRGKKEEEKRQRLETAEKTHVEDEKGKLDLKKGAKRGDKIDQKKDQHRNNEDK